MISPPVPSNMFRRWRAWPMVVLLTAVAFAAGMVVDQRYISGRALATANGSAASTTVRIIGVGQQPDIAMDKNVDFKQFWQLWNLMKEKYYQQPVKDSDLFYGAMAGLAASVGDPYTAYFEPKSADEFQQTLSGKFEGIGAEIGIKNDHLEIIAPLSGTPAEQAGLHAGDILAKINAADTTGMTVEKAVSLIRGPKGTAVTLSVLRPATKKPPFDVTITRQEIHVSSVKSKILPKNIGYIAINQFSGDTSDGFTLAVDDILKHHVQGVIVDLRNDPGGFLETSLHVAGEWLGDDIVVKERRQGKIIDSLHGLGSRRLQGIPTIVLVNQGSASASEIVAGALQDHGQAILVGKKTFGKGSVQDFQNLPDGSAVKITIAEWLTPNERTINKTGLDPDVIVDRTPEDYAAERDPQLDRAVGILQGTATSSVLTTSSTRP